MPRPSKDGANDPTVASLLRRRDKKEALDWLSNPPASVTRTVGELPPAESIALVRRLYKMQAASVDVVKVTTSPNRKYESTDYLLCALPDDQAARTRIFEWERERAFKMGYEMSEEDHGQTHLLIWFD